MMVLEITLQCFNPYSFTNLSELFEILLIVLDSLLFIDSTGDAVGIEVEIKKTEGLLERIPANWHKKYSKCIELENLMFRLQIYVAKKIVRYYRRVCSMINDDF